MSSLEPKSQFFKAHRVHVHECAYMHIHTDTHRDALFEEEIRLGPDILKIYS